MVVLERQAIFLLPLPLIKIKIRCEKASNIFFVFWFTHKRIDYGNEYTRYWYIACEFSCSRRKDNYKNQCHLFVSTWYFQKLLTWPLAQSGFLKIFEFFKLQFFSASFLLNNLISTSKPAAMTRPPPIKKKIDHGKTFCNIFQSTRCLYSRPLKILSFGQQNNKITAMIALVASVTYLLF